MTRSSPSGGLLERRAHRPWIAVAVGGILAGTIDITFACAFWACRAASPPVRIFQSVAAGLLGQAAFSGGLRTAALGALLHFGIALAVAATYWLVARCARLLRERVWVFGSLYGLAVYVVMNHVVVPLSAAGRGATNPLWVSMSVMVHMFGIGVPCALAARSALRADGGRPQS